MEERVSFADRLQHGWNAFRNKDPANDTLGGIGSNNGFLLPSSSVRPDRTRNRYSIDPTMINAIFTRMAIDAAASTFEHIKTNDEGGYVRTITSGLNSVLNLEANIDQTGQELILDLVLSMLDEGCVACVPIETETDPFNGLGGYDIKSMRVGKITNWYPDRISVDLYNEATGMKQAVIVPKKSTAILTNPFYNIMNEPNSTLRRLNRRLALLDVSDEKVNSSKLDMIIQLPYAVRSQTQLDQAEARKERLSEQLQNSELGIAYADGTEKIIQLNRPIENQLMANIEYLTNLLFSQLGVSPSIFDMTANEQTMTNYYKRTIDVINKTIVNEFNRKYLTKTARSQNHKIWYHTEPFRFTPTSELANITDTMVRNEVLSKNEMRAVIGYKPSDSPNANELFNPNMPRPGYLQEPSDVSYYDEEEEVGY